MNSRALADFAIAVAWQSGLVAAAALAVLPALRRAPARLRHAFLVAALIATVLVPFAPRVQRAAVAPTARLSIAPVAQDNTLATVIASAYLLGIAWAAASLAIALRRARQLRASAKEDALDAAVIACRDALDARDVAIRYSRGVTVPVTVGAFAPMILLPRELPQDALLAVLAHEIAHVRRRDTLLQLALEVITLPVAFHPLVRMLKRRNAIAREIACDAHVTPRFVEPRAYARTLLALAHRGGLPRTALAFGEEDALETRLRWLRHIDSPRRRVGLAVATAILITVTLAVPRVRLELFGPRASDFNGAWVLDARASAFGPIRPYDSFTQTLQTNGRSVSSRQLRVRGAQSLRVAWSVETDGVVRPVRVPGAAARGSARWDGSALVVDLAGDDGHRERVRASLSRDANTLVCAGQVQEHGGGGAYRFVFRRKDRA
jgi:beta-lactamase regulating signal transducer with metallopeptidase domain